MRVRLVVRPQVHALGEEGSRPQAADRRHAERLPRSQPEGAPLAAVARAVREQEAGADAVGLRADGQADRVLTERGQEVARRPADVGVLERGLARVTVLEVGARRVEPELRRGVHAADPRVEGARGVRGDLPLEPRRDAELAPAVGVLSEQPAGISGPGVALRGPDRVQPKRGPDPGVRIALAAQGQVELAAGGSRRRQHEQETHEEPAAAAGDPAQAR